MDATTGYIVASIAGTATAGLVGLLAWIGRTIARGDWVPRKTHEDALHTIDTQREHIQLQDERDGAMLLKVAESVEAIMRTVQAKAQETP